MSREHVIALQRPARQKAVNQHAELRARRLARRVRPLRAGAGAAAAAAARANSRELARTGQRNLQLVSSVCAVLYR